MTAPLTALPPTDVALKRVHVGTFVGSTTKTAQLLLAAVHAAQHSATFFPCSTVGPTPFAAQFWRSLHVFPPAVPAREQRWAESDRILALAPAGAAEAVTVALSADTPVIFAGNSVIHLLPTLVPLATIVQAAS